jgi:hypothetical protein
VVVHACNPSPQEDHEFKASLDSIVRKGRKKEEEKKENLEFRPQGGRKKCQILPPLDFLHPEDLNINRVVVRNPVATGSLSDPLCPHL